MTNREKTALLLVSFGVVLVLVAAAAYGGWPAAVGLAGVLAIGFGVLLALDEAAPAELVEVVDRDDDGDEQVELAVVPPGPDDNRGGYPVSVPR